MGLFFSKLYEYVIDSFSSDKTRVLMVGLDAAGKTTILYKIKLNESITTIPTIGFNVETVSIGKGVNFTVWDVGGQEKLRALWRHYYQNSEEQTLFKEVGVSALIFVVDSSDRERLDEARDEMVRVLGDHEMTGVPVVILANKQDLPYALKAPQLIERLQLRSLCSHEWHIQECCAATGDGLYEGLFRCAEMIKAFRRKRRGGLI